MRLARAHRSALFDRILILCTGNICRSPMAQALLRKRWRRPGTVVQSAGTSALVGEPAEPFAIEICREAGVDLSGHRAQQATLPLMASMDLVLTMEQGHTDWVTRQYPQLHGRVHKLLRWRDDAEIADPYRQPRAEFEKAFDAIELGIEDWLRRLR